MTPTTGAIIKWSSTLVLLVFFGTIMAIDASTAYDDDRIISMSILGGIVLAALFCKWRINRLVKKSIELSESIEATAEQQDFVRYATARGQNYRKAAFNPQR